MNLLKKKLNYVAKEKIIYGLMLAIAVALYNFIWLNRTFTISEGWTRVYISLISEGKLPYRDFYYFLPPLNLLMDFIFWKLSFGYFLIFRIWRLIERILITELTYNLINKKIQPFLSAIICFTGTIIASANSYDLIGDYNQTVQLLIILLIYCVLHYFKTDNDKSKIKWILLTGFVGGCMLASKQTVTVASAIIFALLFILLTICKKENNLIRAIICVICGASIPLALIGIYLIGTGSLSDFIYQVFQDTSSKGSLYDILIKSQINLINSRLPVFIAIILIFVSQWIKEYSRLAEKNKNIFSTLCTLISTLLFGAYFGQIIWNTIITEFTSGHIIILGICIFIILYSNINNFKGKFFFILTILGSAILMITNIGDISKKIYSSSIFDCIVEIVCILHLYLLCWVIFQLVLCKAKRQEINVQKLIIVFGALASGYSTSMATGVSSVSSISAFISIPALMLTTSEKLTNEEIIYNKPLVKVFELATLIFFTICLSQKLVCPYSWWGYSDASYWDKTESSSIRDLKGFKFSKEEIRKYDELTKVIANNSDEDSVIFSFPYVKVYNVFLNNYNMDGTVPILFYDVCADDVAESEADILRKKEPDIVVWLDIPNCMEVHESLFRDGNFLGQRKIQKWFSEVKDNDYTLIGQVDNVFIYKLNDGTIPEYTYIERKTCQNETAIYNIEQIECTLEGDGTIESPYLVSSVSDLEQFRDLVNSGKSFFGEYVRQTADIDLGKCGNWEPIGIFDSKKLFEGNYNGDGYNITGLYINYPEQNVGLFGQLAGTVENVSIINCNITGAFVGGIASHGQNATIKNCIAPDTNCETVHNPQIINCVVTGILNGSGRCGGIADNMGGNIVNCVSVVYLNGEVTSGISGYYTNTVKNCYSNLGNAVSIDDGLTLDSESLEKLNEYLAELKTEKYGELLNEWQISDDTMCLTHRYN